MASKDCNSGRPHVVPRLPGPPGPTGPTGPAGSPCCASNGELLLNSSFNDFTIGTVQPLPADWETDFSPGFISHPLSLEQVHTGIGAVIFIIESETPVTSNLFQVVDATPGCWYELMFWLSTNVPHATIDITASLTFLDAGLTPLSSASILIPGSSRTLNYTSYRLISNTAPSRTAHVRAELSMVATIGTVWLDDMQLTVGGCGGVPA